MKLKMHTPDILECLANLSSDEVFTPPAFANSMLDHLPDRVWKDPSLKWLDPCTKSGVFLREAARRLMRSLEPEIPNFEHRREHIYQNMLFGIAISELTALISRRTLYHCKDATLPSHSIVTFDTPEGNVRFPEAICEWKNGRCIHCGVNENKDPLPEGREAHVHPFLHMDLDEIFEEDNMQVDIIMGNPPYQMQDGGGTGKSACPLYNKFVNKAIETESDLITYVIPARWYAGGRGLDKFRSQMLSDSRISILQDYPRSEDVFPGVDIAGGICSFLRDKDHSGDCLIIPNGDIQVSNIRRLDAHEVFIRDVSDLSILEKVRVVAKHQGFDSMSRSVRSHNFFGIRPHELPSSIADKSCTEADIQLVTKDGDKYIPRSAVLKNSDRIDQWKVIASKTNPQGGRPDKQGLRHVISKPRVIPPGSACTETYLVIDLFKQPEPAGRLFDYVKSQFFRFLLSLRTPTHNISRTCFEFIPYLPLDRNWTDEILYQFFSLDSADIDHIESKIKPIS